jgi:outer membrane biosynthesis protein TonB
MKLALSVLLFATATATATAAPAAEPRVVLSDVYAAVELDAAGSIKSVQVQGELPGAMASAVEANVRRLKFTVPSKDGRPVAARTFVRMQTCAQKVGSDYQLSMGYRTQGPMPLQLTTPEYPSEALRAGVSAEYRYVTQVNPDGSVSLSELTRTGRDKRYDREFRRAIQRWVQAQHYRPESVAGSPIGTRLAGSNSFNIGARPQAASDPGLGARDCAEALERSAAASRLARPLDSPTSANP